MSNTSEKNSNPANDASVNDRGLFGHPRGLAWMLQVELWERFSYYGMKAILLYYITDKIILSGPGHGGGLGLPVETGQVIVTAYGTAVFLLSIPGAYFSDRLIGPYRGTLWGALIIISGHLCLTVPVPALSWLGICLVAFGTGFIKPNLSTMVGGLYHENDPRRDAGFQLFYVSINVGSLFAPIIVGLLKAHFGYHVGFSAAAIGMAFALIFFIKARSRLTKFAFHVPNPLKPEERARTLLYTFLGVALIAAIMVILAYIPGGSIKTSLAWTMLIVSGLGSFAYFFVFLTSPKVTKTERRHVRAYIPLWLGAACFFGIFEQAFSKMATFAKDYTNGDLGFFGWSLTPESFQAFNPACVILFSPIIAWIFTKRSGKFPNTATKFVISMIIVGLMAITLGWGFSHWADGSKSAPWYFLAAVFVIMTVAELLISPVGLSTTTMLAPRSFASQAMSLWLLASAFGQSVAGALIAVASSLSSSSFYYLLGGVTLIAAVVFALLIPWTQKQMEDVSHTIRD